MLYEKKDLICFLTQHDAKTHEHEWAEKMGYHSVFFDFRAKGGEALNLSNVCMIFKCHKADILWSTLRLSYSRFSHPTFEYAVQSVVQNYRFRDLVRFGPEQHCINLTQSRTCYGYFENRVIS